jgi:hypothetical protein
MARELLPKSSQDSPIVPPEVGQRALLVYFSVEGVGRVGYRQPLERNMESCKATALQGLREDEQYHMAEVCGVGLTIEVYARYYRSDAYPFYVTWRERDQPEESQRFLKRADAYKCYQSIIGLKKFLDITTNSHPQKRVKKPS